MPRKLRIEYEGAIYHVISRGNYRSAVFARETTKQAFLRCLDEASQKAGWVVHAWCVMSNHYHLCVETPRPNLVEGMRWLQSTFAIRFNRLRKERGHLFQGRYKALLVAPEAVGAVCHYVHLNPVRAGLVPTAELPKYRWSSIPDFLAPKLRPRWLSVVAALIDAGGLDDTPAGRARYLEYLELLQQDEPAKRELGFAEMSKGWAIGTRDFRKELIQVHAHLAKALSTGEGSPREIAQELWEERLSAYLHALGKKPEHIFHEPKGADWKVVLAATMKQQTTASNPWLARHLHMGSPFRLSRLASAYRQDPGRFEPYTTRIAKCKV